MKYLKGEKSSISGLSFIKKEVVGNVFFWEKIDGTTNANVSCMAVYYELRCNNCMQASVSLFSCAYMAH
jgi:hypothetical protein